MTSFETEAVVTQQAKRFSTNYEPLVLLSNLGAMSDFRVLVDGVERIVRGVNGDTSCESVLIALANATGKSGKLALVEKWRDVERILPRDGKPIKYLQKWGRLNKEVKFILKDDSSTEKTDYLSNSDTEVNPNGQVNGSTEVTKRNSLESLVSDQERKRERLARQLDIINLELECAVQNEEDYLYFTEEEITQERAKKLSRVLDLQSRELSVFEAWEGELDKQKQICEKLTRETDSHRQKVRLLEVHVSDLEEVGRKLFSSVQSAKLDSKTTNILDNDIVDPSDLEQEMTIAKEELGKQRLLGERQVKERKRISRSFAELDSLIEHKNGELDSLGKDLSSSISYYDLDEGMKLADLVNDTSTEESDDSEEMGFREITKTKYPPTSLLSRNGTKLSVPSPGKQKSHRQRSRSHAALSGLKDEQGVFV